ncbi:MAG: hypothetical protein CBB68_09695 [Rhodospirillaceae bacterium TMED8]|nr:chemotaxis protein [Magnetovibrio sp.]OUT50132.1 MAG: hypothetical protein CBB68_09695 [Rhodospirillaceae bacterium TMED8]|tara:strand:- start:407 stop:739 length:333 start_codon:yes stop_codon:yes gene_type:complete
MQSVLNSSPIDTLLNTDAAQAIGKTHIAGKNVNLRQMRETAEDFEAVFLSQMLQPMFQNIRPESPFGGGHGEDVWRSMQVQEYGKAITKAGGIGIADAVMREMILMQEAQ